MTTHDTTTYDDYIRGLYRRPKFELVNLVERWAREHGRKWIIGGPSHWTKDELIGALGRIERGEEP